MKINIKLQLIFNFSIQLKQLIKIPRVDKRIKLKNKDNLMNKLNKEQK